VAFGAPRCQSVSGKIALQPAPGACTDLGVTVLQDPITGVEQCFSVTIQGVLKGSGVAGVYAQDVQGLTVPTLSPLLVFGPSPFNSNVRQVLTAKSKLKLKGGDLESQEIILITPAGDVVEQAQLLSGTGAYAGATGSLVILGNSIGQDAKYEGRVCYP